MAATNPWAFNMLGPTCAPLGAISITPHDTNELSTVIRAIEATGAGNVAVVFIDDSTATLALAAGERKTGFIKQVKSTNTTATGLIGLK